MDKVIWITIPRSREVGQSYITSIFTTLKSLIHTYIKLTKLGTIDLTGIENQQNLI
jgi:Oligosaccharide biosynthesis protein Alg14 like.